MRSGASGNSDTRCLCLLVDCGYNSLINDEIGAYMLLLLVSFIIDDCIVNPNLSVCHMCLLFLTMMMMMVYHSSVPETE